MTPFQMESNIDQGYFTIDYRLFGPYLPRLRRCRQHKLPDLFRQPRQATLLLKAVLSLSRVTSQAPAE